VILVDRSTERVYFVDKGGSNNKNNIAGISARNPEEKANFLKSEELFII
jgi:hypothetical protein